MQPAPREKIVKRTRTASIVKIARKRVAHAACASELWESANGKRQTAEFIRDIALSLFFCFILHPLSAQNFHVITKSMQPETELKYFVSFLCVLSGS